NLSYAGTLNVVGNNSPLATMDGTASSFAGCNAGGQGPGGYYVGCGLGGYDLVVTPGGCTGGMTNPTCAGGTDTVTAVVYTNSPDNKIPSMSAGGQNNTADLVAYSAGSYIFSAASWCDGLVYQGFDDWFLPSFDELQTYFYPNRSSVGGFISSGHYASSSGYYDGAYRYVFSGLRTTGASQAMSSYYGSQTGYIRCMRWTPVKTVTPIVDNTPAAMTLNPSYGGPGETRTSNTVTIYGVTAPISISVSGTGAQYSINGGAYTGAAGTVTNGDSITLQATSPALGLESVVTLTTGTISTNWLVRTPGNNTIRIFTTSGGYYGTQVTDSTCTSVANAAGLPGTWIVMASAGTSGIGSILPWNWKHLKNMNGQTVATSVDDFMDGTISAPISYSQTGGAAGGTVAHTGLTVSGTANSTGNCSSWTNNGYGAASGNATAGTTGGSYFYNGGGTVYCSNYRPIVCIESNAAGTDLDPNAVSILPQVTFASGGTGTSNTITIRGVTDEVAVSIVPNAGTADIIKGGVSVGGMTTTAGLNETLEFTLTAPTVLGTKNTATITLGPDTYTWWVGYADSAREAVGFVTSTGHAGHTFGSMAGADAVCETRAAASSYGLSSKWKALLSDSNGNAIDRMPWNWKILKSPTGATIVDDGIPDLFDGTLDGAFITDELGGSAAGARVWSGSTIYGVYDTAEGNTSCSNWTSSGTVFGACGVANNLTSSWINIGSCRSNYCVYNQYRLYCIEDVDNAAVDTTPTSITLPYSIQVPVSSRQTSQAAMIGGMSTGATTTLSVTSTGGDPKFKVNGGAEVTSATVTNGDSVVFLMDAPATGNSFNKMTITAGTMTSYWRVWTGDTTGTKIKRVFVRNAANNGDMGGVVGADTRCQSSATTAGLGGTWKAILSETSENSWAVNRVGYDWSELQLVDGTTVIYAPSLWETATQSLLNPINRNENGSLLTARRVWSATKDDGKPVNTSATSNLHCQNWSSSAYSNQGGQKVLGYSGTTGASWIYGSFQDYSCYDNTNYSLFCIEQ
ncbi:MAG: hypothetical protein PHX61_10910, partial [Alphaproteobacteria bacterium]|nr:hypothetical protein [Alphaproteobacteria bacterium]